VTRDIPCPEWEARLSAYQDGEATPRERTAVAAHLAGCAACRAALARLDADRDRFTEAYAGPYPDVSENVLPEVRAMSRQQQTNVPTPLLRWLVGFSAAAVLVCLALIIAVSTAPRETPMVVYAPDGSAVYEYGADAQGSSVHGRRSGDARAVGHKLYSDNDLYSANDLVAKKRPATFGAFAIASPDAVASRPAPRPPLSDLSGAGDMLYNPTTGRNYGIAGGLKMVYDVGYALQVRNALQAAREGSALIRKHGGFVIDFTYAGDEGQIPAATVRGKVPANEAKAALDALEKMGRVTGITLNGEDLTPQFRQYMEEMEKKIKTAENLGKISDRNRYWETLSAEQARHWAEQQAAQNKRAMLDVVTKSSLVEITATFAEGRPKESFGLAQFFALMRAVLVTLLVALAAVATLFALVALIVAPVVLLRRRAASQEAPSEAAE